MNQNIMFFGSRSVQQIFIAVVILCLVHGIAAGQSQISFGNNKAAGKYYAVRGIKMYCEIYGTGEPLLLIHGNGGSIASFSGIIPAFAKKYTVIATDSRAHGKSVDKNDSLSFEMMADDEAALMDALHIKSAYIIGWSDGGIVALVMAMRHPDKVIKLAATGTNLWPDSTAIIPLAWKEEKAYYDSSHNKTFHTEKEKNNWKVFILDWLQPNIALPSLQKILAPSLIIAGDHDVITLEHTVQIYQHIPHAQLWILPNSGHATLEEHRDEFITKLNDFFKQQYKDRR